MEILAQSALFLAFVSFTFGLTTLSRNFYSKLYQMFAIACISVSLWAFLFFLSFLWNSTRLYDAHLILNCWLTVPVLLFLQRWTHTEKWKGSRFLFYTSLLLSLSLSILLLPGLDRENLIKKIVYFTPTLILFQILWFMAHDKKMRNLSELPRRSLLYGGTFIILTTCLMDHIPHLWLGISVFGNFALMGFLFFIKHNLLKQKFLHLNVFVGRFFVLVFVSGLLTATYSIITLWVKGDFYLFILNSFMLSFFLVNIIPTVGSIMSYIVELFMGDRVRTFRLAISETYSSLLYTVEFKSALERVNTFLFREFENEKTEILVLNEKKECWENRNRNIFFKTNLPIFDLFLTGKNKTPESFSLKNYLEENTLHKKELNSEYREVFDLLGHFYIPLINSEKKWIGILGLNLRGNPEGLAECKLIFQRLADLLTQKQSFDQFQDRERLATLGEVSAGLAHEIRNPLGAIKGAVQLLEEHEMIQKDHESKLLFNVILEETNRLNGFLKEFLEYSKPTTIHPEWILLREACESVYQNILLSQNYKKNEFVFNNLVPPEVMVYFGKQHLNQVLINLFQNAVKALEKKSEKKIECTLHIESEKCILKLLDFGSGISEENLKKIFIPFFTTEPSGTGLGLPITKKLLNSYDVEIEIHSKVEEWTSIELMFPKFKQKMMEGNRL